MTTPLAIAVQRLLVSLEDPAIVLPSFIVVNVDAVRAELDAQPPPRKLDATTTRLLESSIDKPDTGDVYEEDEENGAGVAYVRDENGAWWERPS